MVYTYTYRVPDGKTDVSTEKYIFDGELSYGEYKQHQRTLPHLEGTMEQGFNGQEFWLKLNGETITDTTALKRVAFARPTNFYWFTMMYKLKDPGTNYKYLGTEQVGDITYDKVSLKYDADITKKEKNDEYILFFNQDTHLIDQFYFSLPDWGIEKPILKMTLVYEKVDGILVSTVRKGFMPNKIGDYVPIGVYTFSQVKFNNGFKKEDFLLN